MRNFKCRFCPTSDRTYEISWQALTNAHRAFQKIADDLVEFPEKVEVLRLYKDGEPLINKNLVEMIKYKSGASNELTTTNASLLTKDKSLQLVDAGLDRINISIYGVNNEQYKDFSGVKFEFQKVLENVKRFYEAWQL